MPDLTMQSKKFTAFLISEITWKILLGVSLWLGVISGKIESDMALIIGLMVVISGFVEVAYINKQAALDQYTHLTTMAMQQGKEIVLGQVTVKNKKDGKPNA